MGYLFSNNFLFKCGSLFAGSTLVVSSASLDTLTGVAIQVHCSYEEIAPTKI